MDIRQAALDDTAAISALFRAEISTWQRLDARGRVEDVPYEALTVYERWLHGGAWMSIETGAIFLNHLLLGAGLPFVAVDNDRIAGYAEAYHNVENEPFGTHLHLAHLLADDAETASALLEAVREAARARKCQQVTFGYAAAEAARQSYEVRSLPALRRYSLPARTGQVFYRAVDHTDANPAQIEGWEMPIGRLTSARHQWELYMPRMWDTIAQMHERKTHRLHLAAGGQESYVFCQQQMYDPRSADLHVWTLKGLSAATVTALRDWAHREGYRTLWLMVPEAAVKALGTDAEADAFTLETYAIPARG